MAYKRQIDRLPIIPADAKKHNVTCHYCIVGCGYHAYTWPANKQGGTDPKSNVFGADNCCKDACLIENTIKHGTILRYRFFDRLCHVYSMGLLACLSKSP